MKKNVGYIDRIVRIFIGSTLVTSGVWHLDTTLGIVMVVLGGVLFLTGAFARCALYGAMKCNTCKLNIGCGCCKDKENCDDCNCCKDDKCNTCDIKEKKETQKESENQN